MPGLASSFVFGFGHPLHGADHLVAAIIGLFAFFHGHARGTKAEAASFSAYATGFALATGGLHAAGIGMCRVAGGSIGRAALRMMGALAALGGIVAVAVLA